MSVNLINIVVVFKQIAMDTTRAASVRRCNPLFMMEQNQNIIAVAIDNLENSLCGFSAVKNEVDI